MRAVIAREHQDEVDAVRQVLLGLGLACDAADCVLLTDLTERLAQGPVDLILVRALPGADAAQAAIRRAGQLTQAPIIAYGPVSDPHHILGVGRSGAREYLDESRLRSDLEAALERLRLANEVDYGQGSVVSVVGAMPGCGVTTVSTNLAFAYAGEPMWGRSLTYPATKAGQRPAPHELGARGTLAAKQASVVLVEFGRPPADLAVNLDLKPQHSAAAVCARWQELDTALLRQAVVEHAGGVAVLAHAPETMRADGVDPRAVHPLLVLVRRVFATAVFDIGHALEAEHYEAMRQSDQVVVVVRLDVPGLRQTRRLLRELHDQGVQRNRIHLAANRYGQTGQVPWRQAEETLGASFLEYVPDDCGAANEALNHGQPLVLSAPRSRISKALIRLAEQLVEQRNKT